jgi:hypothetical protein
VVSADLRGPSTAQLAKYASCFAQDDKFGLGLGRRQGRRLGGGFFGGGKIKVTAETTASLVEKV